MLSTVLIFHPWKFLKNRDKNIDYNHHVCIISEHRCAGNSMSGALGGPFVCIFFHHQSQVQGNEKKNVKLKRDSIWIKGLLHPNQILACLVLYRKIVNTFPKK